MAGKPSNEKDGGKQRKPRDGKERRKAVRGTVNNFVFVFFALRLNSYYLALFQVHDNYWRLQYE